MRQGERSQVHAGGRGCEHGRAAGGWAGHAQVGGAASKARHAQVDRATQFRALGL